MQNPSLPIIDSVVLEPVVDLRTCGECDACCTIAAVEAFKKPVNTKCMYQRRQETTMGCVGCCSIYAQRPAACAAYQCSWLDGHLPLLAKPNKHGVIFETAELRTPEGRVITLLGGSVDPRIPIGLQMDVAQRFAMKMKEYSVPKGTVCMLVVQRTPPFDPGSDEIDESEGTVVYIGARSDVAEVIRFFEESRQRGEISMVYADGVIKREKL